MAMDWTLIVRLVLAAILAGVIGLEREKSGKHFAGLRTHIIVAIASALLMATFQDLFLGDSIARMGAAIMTGLGFIGAGTIISQGDKIKGLTTAATVWAVAGIGIVVGLGAYFEAIVGTLLIFIVLEMKKFENK